MKTITLEYSTKVPRPLDLDAASFHADRIYVDGRCVKDRFDGLSKPKSDETPLETFLYLLLRDSVPAGEILAKLAVIEQGIEDGAEGFQCTNQNIVALARDILARLRRVPRGSNTATTRTSTEREMSMKQAPTIWRLGCLLKYIRTGETQTEYAPGKWGPARPLGFFSLRSRLRAAWLVFTGKADAVIWEYDS
jgi:hypothetical protein